MLPSSRSFLAAASSKTTLGSKAIPRLLAGLPPSCPIALPEECALVTPKPFTGVCFFHSLSRCDQRLSCSARRRLASLNRSWVVSRFWMAICVGLTNGISGAVDVDCFGILFKKAASAWACFCVGSWVGWGPIGSAWNCCVGWDDTAAGEFIWGVIFLLEFDAGCAWPPTAPFIVLVWDWAVADTPPRWGDTDGFRGRLWFTVTDSLVCVDGEWILELTAPGFREVELCIGDRRVGVVAVGLLIGSGVLSLSANMNKINVCII